MCCVQDLNSQVSEIDEHKNSIASENHFPVVGIFKFISIHNYTFALVTGVRKKGRDFRYINVVSDVIRYVSAIHRTDYRIVFITLEQHFSLPNTAAVVCVLAQCERSGALRTVEAIYEAGSLKQVRDSSWMSLCLPNDVYDTHIIQGIRIFSTT